MKNMTTQILKQVNIKNDTEKKKKYYKRREEDQNINGLNIQYIC